MNKTNDITQELADLFKAEKQRLLKYACYKLGNEDDAKDVLQETFLKIHARIAETDERQINDMRNYIFKTLTNVCTKWQSSSRHLKTIPLGMMVDIADVTADAKNEEDYTRIINLLAEIPEEQAEVIRLRIYGNNSFADVAEILSLPLPTVKSRFLYGLDKIRKIVKQNS